MNMNKKIILAAAVLMMLALNACKKETEEIKIDAISDYAPLEVGKYIVYELDSFVFRAFGTGGSVVSYEVKYSLTDTLTDNLGRKGYRVSRQIRKAPADAWVTDNTFKAVNTGTTYDFTEDNLHFINLALPIKEGLSWKGNSYLPSDPYFPKYDFGSDFSEDWDYTYQDVGKPFTAGALNFDNTITILQRDETQGDPALPETVYADKTYAIEKYAKGIGLVYKEFLHWEYQGEGNSYKGFGITLRIKEHN
jgi:hypothetical protein